LIQAIIYQESRGDVKAKSKAGAAGLMQLMPGTAKELGVKNVFDAKQNIAAGTKYVEKMRKRFGDDSLALAAYNWGPGNVSKAVRQAAKALKKDASEVTWDDILSEVTVPAETRKYVERVFRLREQFSGQV
jgi:soluble lytic murein transglycosylase-like protein